MSLSINRTIRLAKKISAQTRLKMSLAHIGRKYPPERHRANTTGENNGMYGKRHSARSKRKMSASAKHNWHTPETRQHYIDSFKTRIRPPKKK